MPALSDTSPDRTPTSRPTRCWKVVLRDFEVLPTWVVDETRSKAQMRLIRRISDVVNVKITDVVSSRREPAGDGLEPGIYYHWLAEGRPG